MSEDWRAELEWWVAILEVWAAKHESETLEAAEVSLAQDESPWPFPMPSTAHHSLERHADMVRSMNLPTFVVATRPRTSAFMVEDEFPTSISENRVLLTRRRVFAPAPVVRPTVDDDAVYVWQAWVDDYGRHVTTDAELVWK